jgi:hypothetical protein
MAAPRVVEQLEVQDPLAGPEQDSGQVALAVVFYTWTEENGGPRIKSRSVVGSSSKLNDGCGSSPEMAMKTGETFSLF